MWLLLVLWLVAPLVELVVIVGLCVENDKKKRRLRELEEELKKYGRPELGQRTGAEAAMPAEPVPAVEENRVGQSQQLLEQPNKRMASVRGKTENIKGGGMGILALLTGVVFVVLAGLIFATTAWKILSNPAKVYLVLAFSVMFFGVSFVAEKRLHIHKTGNALYILGSIFLFLSVLAAAYFQLLGPEYVLVGQNRWRVLWIGSLLTVVMLFGGIGRFRDRIYTQVCFGGMTVSMTFWALAHGLNQGGEWLSMMMGYAWLLMLGKWLLEKQGTKKNTPIFHLPVDGQSIELVREGFSWFAPVHFWFFSTLVVGLGTVSGIFLLTPWLRWYLALALGAVLLGIVMQKKETECKWKKAFFCLAMIGTVHYLTAWIGFEIAGRQKPEGMGALVVAGMIVALGFLAGNRRKSGWDSGIEEWLCLAFLSWDAFLPGFQVFLIKVFGANDASNFLREHAFWALAGALILTVTMAVRRRKSELVQWALPFLLWYMVFWPLDLWLRCEIGYGLEKNQAELALCLLDRGMPGFLLLCGMISWEWKRQEGYGWAILILGTWMEMIYFSETEVTFPFFLLLAGYLLSEIRTEKRKEDRAYKMLEKLSVLARDKVGWRNVFQKKSWLCRWGTLYAMMGTDLWLAPFTIDNRMLRLVGALGTYVAGLVLERTLAKDPHVTKGRSVFWDICGSFLAVFIICECYTSCYDSIYISWSGSGSKEFWNLLFCLTVFVGFYQMFYLGKRFWPHLIISIAMMPMPLVLALCYDWTENQLYLTVLGSLLFTGIVARCHGRICEPKKEIYGGWRVDWYHVTAIFLLILLAGMNEEGHWRLVCLLYLSIYILQFSAIPEWRRATWSAVGLLLVLAYWSQPFFELPSQIKLELELLPVAGYFWYLGKVWEVKRRKETKEKEKIKEEKTKKEWELLQTMGYFFCLLVLMVNAWLCGEVVHALILEGICLTIFVWALVRHCRHWIGMAGTILILVALYMTKEFWLSISWWVYLLAAGMGLIVFAAVSEKRKRE